MLKIRVCYPSGHFLGIRSEYFSQFWHAVRNPYTSCLRKPGFFDKKSLCPNWNERGPKMGQK